MEQAEIAQQDVSDQRAASQFMMQAANGIERFAGSLKNKPFADVIDNVRTFGQENSGALIADSLLAGLALGRFVKSSMPATGAQRQPQQRTGGDGPWTADEFGQLPARNRK